MPALVMNGNVSRRISAVITPLLLLAAVFFFLFTGEAKAELNIEDCEQCHEDYVISFARTNMGKVFFGNPQDELQKSLCEACHGPTEGHLKNLEESDELDLTKIISFKPHSTQSVAVQNGMCLQCHEEDYNRKAWRGSAHETQDVACVNCHTIMKSNSPTKQLKKKTVVETCYQCHPQKRAQIRKSSHMPIAEGKAICTKCHNPHGGEGDPLLKQASVNETCYQCHADKRGPLLWEHAPVRENCENCHDPHGSNNARLLKRKVPFLCQSCHVSALHPSEVYDARRIVGGAFPAGRIAGKGCVNCHSRIHGSNHPSGARFQR